MTYLVETTSNRLFTLTVTPLGGGAGDRPKLAFESKEALASYLRDELTIPHDVVESVLEKGVLAVPLDSTVAARFWSDVTQAR